jgi:nucleotide-binding universal stress UspA family protein
MTGNSVRRSIVAGVDGSAPALRAARWACDRMAGRLAGEYPQVRVCRVVTGGRPAKCLIDEAAGAQLLVVGSRGHGGFAGKLLGSTSQALIHHAPCPLLVVRPIAAD